MIWRIERGTSRTVPLAAIHRIAAVVGLTVSMRLYPDGDPIRDVAHARLLDRFRRELHVSIMWRTEVPLPHAHDRRAWDAMISRDGWWRPIEAETVIGDTQALERRLTLKQRDADVEGIVLVVADTTRNRAALAAAPAAFAALPRRGRAVLAAVRGGRDPGPGLVLL